MNVVYKCRCMAAERTIACPDRVEGQDVVDWMEGSVTPAVAANHSRFSPRCFSRTMEYVKFEIDPSGETPIGNLPRQ